MLACCIIYSANNMDGRIIGRPFPGWSRSDGFPSTLRPHLMEKYKFKKLVGPKFHKKYFLAISCNVEQFVFLNTLYILTYQYSQYSPCISVLLKTLSHTFTVSTVA